MNQMPSMNINNTNVDNFHSSANDTVEPPVDRTRTLSELKRKRILKAIVFIVATLLIAASIVLPTTILLRRETYTVDNATTTIYITQTSIKTAASLITKSTVSQAITTTVTSTSRTSVATIATSTPRTSVTTIATSTQRTSVITTVTANIPGPASTACTSDTDKSLFNNEFIYSPTSQMYAAGLLNNQFGIYKAYGSENVTSSAVWLADQKSVPGIELKLQRDRNLMVYGSAASVWGTGTYNTGAGQPFCIKLLDSGKLLWTDNDEKILWETNSDSLFNVL